MTLPSSSPPGATVRLARRRTRPWTPWLGSAAHPTVAPLALLLGAPRRGPLGLARRCTRLWSHRADRLARSDRDRHWPRSRLHADVWLFRSPTIARKKPPFHTARVPQQWRTRASRG